VSQALGIKFGSLGSSTCQSPKLASSAFVPVATFTYQITGFCAHLVSVGKALPTEVNMEPCALAYSEHRS
jgi:hypothetical protein